MEKISLNLLLEEVMGDIINTTHYLKQVVDKYKYYKMGTNPLILDSDFNSLNVVTPENKRFIDSIAAGSQNIYSFSYDKPFNRVYNFYQNLNKTLSTTNNVRVKLSPNDKELYKHALEELKNLAKKAANNKIQTPKDRNNIKSKLVYSLEQTKFLKDNNVIYLGNDDYDYIGDEDFYAFTDKTNTNVDTVYEAILNGDKSLRLQLNTPENKVYNLWLRLKNDCLNTMFSYVQLLKLSGMDPTSSKNNNKQIFKKELTETTSIHLKSLSDGSEIGMGFNILTKAVSHEIESSINETFEFFHLRGNYEFFNENKKNHKLIFARNVPNTINVGDRYDMVYFLSKDYSEYVTIQITSLKSKTIESIAQVKECNSAEELKKLIYNIRNNS